MPRQLFYRPVRLNRKKASVLIVCLWAIMILSILGMGLSGLAFQEIRFIKSYQALSLSLPVARSAAKAVFFLRSQDPTPGFDTLDELTMEAKQFLCGENGFKYYYADKVNSAGKAEVIDESALINLNTATKDILERLPGMNDDLAEEIVFGGLRPFSSVYEVLLIDGMSKENFMLFKDLVTVYGQGRININSASAQVLSALGLDKEVVEAILRFRKEHKIPKADPNEEGDLGHGFSSTDRILDELRNFSSLGVSQQQDILSLLSVFDVKSDHLRLNVIPFFGEKEGLHYSIVVHPGTKKVLSWTER